MAAPPVPRQPRPPRRPADPPGLTELAPRLRRHLAARRPHRGRHRSPTSCWPASRPRPDLDVTAFAVTRARGRADGRRAAGRGHGGAPADGRPDRCGGAGAASTTRRSSGGPAPSTWCTGPTSSSRRPDGRPRSSTVHDLTCVRFPEMCTPDVLQVPGLLRRAIARRGMGAHGLGVRRRRGRRGLRRRPLPGGGDPQRRPDLQLGPRCAAPLPPGRAARRRRTATCWPSAPSSPARTSPPGPGLRRARR